MPNALENGFGRLVIRFICSMVDVEALHDDVELATHSSRTDFLDRGKQRLKEAESLPDFAGVLQGVGEITGGNGLDFLAGSTTDNSLDALRRKSDAASVVFGHSLLDALLFDLCKLSLSIDPKDWFPLVSRRQVKANVEELLAKGTDLVAAEVALTLVDSLERESILRKATSLHAICQPSNTKGIIRNFTFSESDLRDFDLLRHEIVHGLKFRKPIPAVASHLEYARLTGIYFCTMVGRKYGLQITLSEPDIVDLFKPDLS